MFDPEIKANEKEAIKCLKPYLSIKSKVELNKMIKVVFEEFIILLVWFSCIFKQSIFSYVIFFVITYHTYSKEGKTG
jgi:hypothetical protein